MAFKKVMTNQVKYFCVQIKREKKKGKFRIITNFIFCLSMLLCIILLIMFISAHVRNTLSEDLYVPRLYKLLLSINFTSMRTLAMGGLDAPSKLWHSMSDEELMWRASTSPHVVKYTYNRPPKVAFMFLVRERLPLGPIWEKFFRGQENLYSVYLHCSHGCIDKISNSSVFYKRIIPSKLVEWGKASMIDAERRLLANALLDFSNERFILLSETCIPLFNFTTIYNYLINSNQSFLSSFDDPRRIGRGRYNKQMSPTITINDWRKGSQWFEVHRRHAIGIVSDKKYYPIFCDHCRPPCYMDEHYLATLLGKLLHPELNSNRTITWVDWSAGGPHPKTFTKKDVSEAFLSQIRYKSNCTYNGSVSSICFLFARKFHPSSLEMLERLAPTFYGF